MKAKLTAPGESDKLYLNWRHWHLELSEGLDPPYAHVPLYWQKNVPWEDSIGRIRFVVFKDYCGGTNVYNTCPRYVLSDSQEDFVIEFQSLNQEDILDHALRICLELHLNLEI